MISKDKFENDEYNKRVDYINEVFQSRCMDYEEITVYADIGWKASFDIYIRYESVKNKKHVHESGHLDPKLMCDLSDSTISAICNDLLCNWRAEE
jgi:hypothetical protein